MYSVEVSKENMFLSYTDTDMLVFRYGNILRTCFPMSGMNQTKYTRWLAQFCHNYIITNIIPPYRGQFKKIDHLFICVNDISNIKEKETNKHHLIQYMVTENGNQMRVSAENIRSYISDINFLRPNITLRRLAWFAWSFPPCTPSRLPADSLTLSNKILSLVLKMS